MAILSSDKLDFLLAAGTGGTLTGTEVKVLLHVVACIDNKTGLARIGHARLAERSGVHRGTVIRALAQLEKLGILPVTLRGGADRGGERTANVYRPNLHYTAPTSSTHATGSLDATGCINAADQSHGCNGPVAPMLHHPGSSPGGFPEGEEEGSPPYAAASAGAPADRNEREIGAPAGEPDRFDEFWAVCRKQEGRAKAKTAYAKALAQDGVSADILIAAMTQYTKAKAHLPDTQWIKLPCNWLDEERWLEKPEAPKPKEPPTPKSATKASTAPKVKAAARPEKAKRKVAKTTRKATQPASGRGLAPQAVAAPAITRTPDEPFIVRDRVEEARTKRNWAGKVTRIEGAGRVRVAWDHGGGAICRVTDLAPTSISACEGLRRNRERGA
ncbi:helix-turn-helix domain-containing protein [Azospirillum doebereinerae]|uniref:helix-turn-helix domain-containing protein n=1 Tax=Azospirillum doebereinerae TaxID=92933 RepID=UPI00163CB424|nr:helix-turn-helix domain-containing protein [Azospirillum doebereinerae]